MAQRNTEVEAHGQTEASGEVAGKVVQAARAKERGDDIRRIYYSFIYRDQSRDLSLYGIWGLDWG